MHHSKLFFILGLVLASTSFHAQAAPAVALDYPIQAFGCTLSSSDVAGVSNAGTVHRFGDVVQTKHGKWRCTKAIVRQLNASSGGIWVAVDGRP